VRLPSSIGYELPSTPFDLCSRDPLQRGSYHQPVRAVQLVITAATEYPFTAVSNLYQPAADHSVSVVDGKTIAVEGFADEVVPWRFRMLRHNHSYKQN
jgi:hypothetical protein